MENTNLPEVSNVAEVSLPTNEVPEKGIIDMDKCKQNDENKSEEKTNVEDMNKHVEGSKVNGIVSKDCDVNTQVPSDINCEIQSSDDAIQTDVVNENVIKNVAIDIVDNIVNSAESLVSKEKESEDKAEPIPSSDINQSSNEILKADDAMKSVIKDILDALQTTTPAEILSQVQDVKPPAGYISELEWKKKETALLVEIAKLKEDNKIKQEAMEIKLKMKNDECEMTKVKLKTLDTELRAVCGNPNTKNKEMVSKIKKNHDDLLTKARGMIFEKTKMIKNQELKIEALTAQVESLREIVTITKDMLNIRNMECKHLQDKMDTVELRLQAEKEKQNFMMKKLEMTNKLHEEMKAEYLKQAELFKCLKARYEEKDKMATAEKDSTK